MLEAIVICEISESRFRERRKLNGKWAISRLSFDKGARQRLLIGVVFCADTRRCRFQISEEYKANRGQGPSVPDERSSCYVVVVGVSSSVVVARRR